MPHRRTGCWSGPKEHSWYPGASPKEKYHIAFLTLLELVILILYHTNLSSGAAVFHIPPCTLLGYPQYFLKDFFFSGFSSCSLGSSIRNTKYSYMGAFVFVFSLASETLRKLREIKRGSGRCRELNECLFGIADYFSNIINWALWYSIHPPIYIPVQLKHSSCFHVLLKVIRGWYVCDLESYVFYNVNILWG